MGHAHGPWGVRGVSSRASTRQGKQLGPSEPALRTTADFSGGLRKAGEGTDESCKGRSQSVDLYPRWPECRAAMPPYLDEAEWTNWAQQESHGTSAFSPQGTLTGQSGQRASGHGA